MGNGIFISKGMSLTISNIRLSFDADGDSNGSMSLDLRFDTCSAWLKVALKQRELSLAAETKRVEAWGGTDENAKGETIEDEFLASIQAIVAAASAIDAFYAIIKDSSPVPLEVAKGWTSNRTPRQRQVSETLKLAFGLKVGPSKKAYEILDGIYRIRGAALHPLGRPIAPYFHPDLQVHTEWRLVTFRAAIADAIVCGAVSLIWDLAYVDGRKEIFKSAYLDSLRKTLSQLLPAGKPIPRHDSITFNLPDR
jgi:hypothetical protein